MARGGIDELNDDAAHAPGDFERRNREIKLVHAAADEFHEEPEEKTAAERNLGPDIEMILSGMFIKMANRGMNRGRIEVRAAQGVEIGDEAGVGRGKNSEIFVAGNAVVNGSADRVAVAEWTA